MTTAVNLPILGGLFADGGEHDVVKWFGTGVSQCMSQVFHRFFFRTF